MVFGTKILLAMAAALLGTLMYTFVTGEWNDLRRLVARFLYGVALAFVVLYGPIVIP